MNKPDIETGDWWTYTVTVGNYNIESKVQIEGKETFNINGTLVETWNISTQNPFFYELDYHSTKDFSLVKEIHRVKKGLEHIYPVVNYSFTLYDPVSFWPIETGKNLSYQTLIKIITKSINQTVQIKGRVNFNCTPEMVKITTEEKEYECYEVIKHYSKNIFFNGKKIYHYYSEELDWFVEYKVEKPNGELFYRAILKDYKGKEKNNNEDTDVNKKENNYFTFLLIGILMLLITLLSVIVLLYHKYKKKK